MNPSTPNGPRVLLTVEQAAEQLGVGRTTVFALIKSGELPAVKLGRLRRVPLAEVEAYTARLMADQHPTTAPPCESACRDVT